MEPPQDSSYPLPPIQPPPAVAASDGGAHPDWFRPTAKDFVPLAPPQTYRQPKKSAFPIVIAAIVVVVAGFMTFERFLGAAMDARDKAIVAKNGGEPSPELKEGVAELVAMVRGAKAGDPASLNLAKNPKTALGKKFKALASRSQATELRYARVMKGRAIGELLTAQRLGTAAGRSRSAAEAKAMSLATAAYFSDARSIQDDMYAMIEATNGQIPVPSQALRRELRERGRAMLELFTQAEEIIAYAQKTKPTVRKGYLSFASAEHEEVHNAFAEEFNASAEALATTAQSQMNSQQKRLDSAMDRYDRTAL